MARPSTIPARGGIGLKAEHYRHIIETKPNIGFFEIHAENYMGEGGPPHRYLEAIRERYPLSLHGVGLSIGGPGPLDRAHLGRLKALIGRYEPGLFSEHLAWSSHGAEYLADLLPLLGDLADNPLRAARAAPATHQGHRHHHLCYAAAVRCHSDPGDGPFGL